LPPLLRIAHVSPAYFSDDSLIGGGERYVSYTVRAVREGSTGLPFNIEQQVFALGNRDHSYDDGGVPVQVLRNESHSRRPMSAASPKLWNLLSSFDVVHIHQALTVFGCYCAVIARTLNKTIIMTDLGGGENELLLKHGGIQLSDGLLSISAFAKSLLSGYFKGPHEAVIGPVDTGTFRPSHSSTRKTDVLVVGRILPHKGIDRIIDALPSGLPLKVVGRNYHDRYFRLLRKRASGKDVTFITEAGDTDLQALYQTSGLYVQASTYVDVYGSRTQKPELMGLTTLEALASGMPAAVAHAASLPELATDKRFTRIFRDHDELTSVLKEYKSGTWPGPDAGELAREHAVTTYSFDVVGKRIARFYSDVHQARMGGGS
jgi:glycosyltransferase involved in cell wall biosynthesis